MIIMRIFGGMASQIDKYILGREVADYLGTELCLDIHDYVDGYFRPFILEYFTLPDEKLCLMHPVKAYGRKIKLIGTGEELIKACENYNDEILYLYRESKDYEAFCDKFPQMRRNDKNPYFKTIRPKLEYEGIKSFKEKIKDKFSIAVQIRRGDFVDLGWEDDIESYKGAIGHLLQNHKDAHFYIFSNDLEYCRQHLGTSQYLTYVQNSVGTIGDIEDFCCIAMCNAVVISSFSGYARTAACIGAQQGGKCHVVALKNTGELPENVLILNENDICKGVEFYNNIGESYISNSKCLENEQDYYGLLSDKKIVSDYLKIVFVSYDIFSRTNVRYGFEEMARIISHNGIGVLFISINNNGDNSLKKATDWDGRYLGYEICEAKNRGNIDSTVENWCQFSNIKDVLVISDIRIMTKYQYVYVKKYLDLSMKYSIKDKLSAIKRNIIKTLKIYKDGNYNFSREIKTYLYKEGLVYNGNKLARLRDISNENIILKEIEEIYIDMINNVI